jgi:NAD(P)-dependent dehydrogenase (short-subunit alcohol dehydrogenase family)
MEINGTNVIVTGGASGIGYALAKRFAADGAAHVTIADVGTERTERAATELGVEGFVGDLSTADGVAALIDQVEQRHGFVDLFCANAGIGLGTDPITTTDAEWDQIWRINTMQHVWAARRLLPSWLDHGKGYLMTTASAAGLLSQIGSAPYSVTKAGAVAFAEWMSITYGDRGVGVSCLCPQGVNTPLLNGPGDLGSTSGSTSLSAGAVKAGGDVLEPDDVAQIVANAIRANEFLILPHPEVQTYLERKATDRLRWIKGMRKLQARLS